MRARLVFASASAVVVAFAACTSSEAGGPELASTPEGGVLPPAPDASPTDAAPNDETDAAVPNCSQAGWCATALPDADLGVKDIWPLSGRAFAIAESGTLGVKVLEWTNGDGWQYIDDNTQNEVGGKYAGAIWAPNDNTVYYAVAPSYIYQGTRLSPPHTGWTWSRQRLEDNSHGAGTLAHSAHDHGYMQKPGLNEAYPSLGVWGIDASNVYAWYSNTVYQWAKDDLGAPRWHAAYVADDPDIATEHLFFVSAAGSGPDDVWFAGVRSTSIGGTNARQNCALLVRKTPEGLTRIADGIARSTGCADRVGFARIGEADGWFWDTQATGPGAITGLKGASASDILRISADGDTLTVEADPVPTVTSNESPFRSFWRSPSAVWLTARGLVVRGQGTGDAGTYAISTLSLNGGAVTSPMHRVRGTSDTNLWAIGNGYAFHKTTP